LEDDRSWKRRDIGGGYMLEDVKIGGGDKTAVAFIEKAAVKTELASK
jgi:hypothetical protein